MQLDLLERLGLVEKLGEPSTVKFNVQVSVYGLRLRKQHTQPVRTILARDIMELPRKQPILKEKDRDDLLLLTKYARAVNGDRSLPIGNITVVEGAKENVLHSIQRSVENCVVSQDKKLKKVVKDVGVLDFLKTLSVSFQMLNFSLVSCLVRPSTQSFIPFSSVPHTAKPPIITD